MTNIIPKEALEKAIEGGWTNGGFITTQSFPNGWSDVKTSIGNYNYVQRTKKDGTGGRWVEISRSWAIALEPDFWIALGKVKGWREKIGEFVGYEGQEMYEHQFWAHELLSLILKKDQAGIDAFWKEILNQ